MTKLLRATWVIARRDYVATVWSRTFLLFLIGPMLPLLFGGLVSVAVGGEDAKPSGPPVVQVVARPADWAALSEARTGLAERLGRDALPRLVRTGRPDLHRPALLGGLLAPHLFAERDELPDLQGPLALIVDHARLARVRTALPPPVHLLTFARPSGPKADNHRDIAHGGQFLLFFLVLLLSGTLISNLVEEKSSRVIELLTAAVPVDAIFLGKLVGMLGVSLTGIAAWGVMGAFGAGLLLPHGSLPAAPAVGWPMFALLALAYFTSVYLLLGALYLGIGAQAGSVREVQTVAMPLSLGQFAIFALASAAVAHPNGTAATVAAILPWSSPYAMLGRAALKPGLSIHLLALCWQLICILLSVRLAAALFRTNILKTGRARRKDAHDRAA